jgi:hypothetical protein
MAEPAKRDASAPKFLQFSVKDSEGKEWSAFTATEKQFSSGSVGYYASAKLTNPVSGERYQVGCNITLVGSKPKE